MRGRDKFGKEQKMKKEILLNLVILLVTVASAPAATRLVPDEYATIQAAIDAAADGDVVIIAPDTYTGDGNRDIDFLGKAVTVRSIDPNDPNIIAATIINCNGTEAEPHRGFYFHSGEDCNSVVSGFTITNGYANRGGGIYCVSSNPTLIKCIFSGNSSRYDGGGVYNYASSPTISNCTFSKNSAGEEGGGINNCSHHNGAGDLPDCGQLHI